ncbi:MAG: hypothetical protein Q9223_001796, partial [Gallowayella weberi]
MYVRRRKAELDDKILGLTGLYFIVVVFALWSWVNGASGSWSDSPFQRNHTSNATTGDHDHGLANLTFPIPVNTNDPSGPRSQCNDSSWSPGSAFFTTVALTFGYFAHPRGSSIYPESGRIWRLSPLFAAYETGILLCRLVIFSGWRSYDLRTVSYTLLACRVGNAWNEVDYERFVSKLDRKKEDALEAGQLSEHIDEPVEAEVGTLRNTKTWAHPGDLPSTGTLTQLSEEIIPKQGTESLDTTLIARKRQQIFYHHLDIVDTFEHGPNLRLFVWIPMLFQVAKLLVVRGAWWSRMLGFIYFISWLVIEMLSIICAQHDFTPLEREAAFELGRILNAPNWKSQVEPDHPIEQNAATICGQFLLFLHGVVNWILLGRILRFHTFYALFLSFISFIPFIGPIPLFLIAGVVVGIWNVSGFKQRFGSLWFENTNSTLSFYAADLALFSLVLEAL